MKYFLTPRAFGTVEDTSVSRLWQRTFIKSLAVRVMEEEFLSLHTISQLLKQQGQKISRFGMEHSYALPESSLFTSSPSSSSISKDQSCGPHSTHIELKHNLFLQSHSCLLKILKQKERRFSWTILMLFQSPGFSPLIHTHLQSVNPNSSKPCSGKKV